MKFLIQFFYLIISLFINNVVYAKNLELLQQDFFEIKSEMDIGLLEDVVDNHQKLLEVIELFSSRKSMLSEDYDNNDDDFSFGAKSPSIFSDDDIFSDNRFEPKEKRKEKKKTFNEEHLINKIIFDIHTDVVFVGFPASAIEVIRDKWFDSLGSHDSLMVSLGDNNDILVVPGDTQVRHHFHLVQVSFKVVDIIRKQTELLLRKDKYKSNNINNNEIFKDSYYINSWEMEDIFDRFALYIYLSIYLSI
jgi:hypothetical protein